MMFRKKLLLSLFFASLFVAHTWSANEKASSTKAHAIENVLPTQAIDWPKQSFKYFWGRLGLSHGAEVKGGERYFWIKSPTNKQYLNYLYLPHADSKDRDFKEGRSVFKGKPYLLYVDEGAKLKFAGSRFYENFREMVLPINSLKIRTYKPNLEVREATTKKDFALWVRLASERTRVPLKLVRAMYKDFWENKDLGARFYLGYLSGLPAGTSLAVYEGDYVSMYYIGVQKEFRMNGLGTALTIKPIRDAECRGQKYIVLHASKLGVNVYKKLGFRDVGGYDVYFAR